MSGAPTARAMYRARKKVLNSHWECTTSGFQSTSWRIVCPTAKLRSRAPG